MKVHCLFDEMIAVEKLTVHPKNRNTHPDDQIARLAEILKYQGWRYPIKVSKRSGYVTSGHGRLLAAIKNKWKTVPVNRQVYDDDDQEYADVQADNAIAVWAELELSAINVDVGDLGPDFDINLLGLKNFTVDIDFNAGSEEDQGKLDEKKPIIVKCPNCAECFDANENKT